MERRIVQAAMITKPHHASGNRADAHMRARGLPDRYFLLFGQRSGTQGLTSTQSAVKSYTETAVRRKQEGKGHKDLISEPLAQPCCELPLHCRCLARWLHALSGNLILVAQFASFPLRSGLRPLLVISGSMLVLSWPLRIKRHSAKQCNSSATGCRTQSDH